MENSFKSHIKIYWSALMALIATVIIISFFLIKDFKNFSFEFYFLMMIPLWIGVLSANGYETLRIKQTVREYVTLHYPKKMLDFDEKPVDLLNSDTEDVLDLFQDQELILDPIILNLSKEARKITVFMYGVFFSMPILLITTVFFILKK